MPVSFFLPVLFGVTSRESEGVEMKGRGKVDMDIIAICYFATGVHHLVYCLIGKTQEEHAKLNRRP